MPDRKENAATSADLTSSATPTKANERLLPFSFGKTVRDSKVENAHWYWSEFVAQLREPVPGEETQAEYLQLSQEQQDVLKDVGYYVPCHFKGGVRRLVNSTERHCVTLDWDHPPINWKEVLRGDGLTGIGTNTFVAHTTRKHRPDKPRVRIIILLSRGVNTAEYGAVARRLAADICDGAIEYCDDTTFDYSRAMHFPSRSADGKYELVVNNGASVDPDTVMEQYGDWHDISSWPVSSRVRERLRQPGKRAQDPRTKGGIVGAFCRIYDIETAIEKFLPGVYVPGNAANRWTFAGGSTSNGAVVYEGGQFLYSHHESDPCGGQLVNSFDMVRVHQFGALDVDVASDAVIGDRPSQKAMIKLAAAEPLVAAEYLEAKVAAGEITREDFWNYLPTNQYIFTPTGAMWPAGSVDKRLPPTPANGVDADGDPYSTSIWLSYHRRVEQMTWHPAEPPIINDRLVAGGGWIERKGTFCYNLYQPPTLILGDARAADPWLEHVRLVYPNDADHIIKWLAFKVQRPGDKINHILVLGGSQGIGKDTILTPVASAVGPWNFADESPGRLLGRFNGFVKSVILRVSEAHDLGDVDRYAFYEHMKSYAAAPPNVIMCDEKFMKEIPVFNVMGVVMTTNHRTDGIHLPADDRRHYVAWSELSKEQFAPDYWITLHAWYASGGDGHVAAYLHEVDLAGFDAKAPPPLTPAFWSIVDAGKAPEDAELADAIDKLGDPAALTLRLLTRPASQGLRMWLDDRRNRRTIPHRLESAGYTAVRNGAAADGMFVVDGRRQAIYARTDLPISEREAAATAIARTGLPDAGWIDP